MKPKEKNQSLPIDPQKYTLEISLGRSTPLNRKRNSN